MKLIPLLGGLLRPRAGNALLETAIVVPVVLIVAFGIVGVGRLTHAKMAVTAVAREAAHAAALAETAGEAQGDGEARGADVATGYGISGADLAVTVGDFCPGSWVAATAAYDVSLANLPMVDLGEYTVQAQHAERVDVYASWQGDLDCPTGGE